MFAFFDLDFDLQLGYSHTVLFIFFPYNVRLTTLLLQL